MFALVIVLIAANLATAAVLLYVLIRPNPQPQPADPAVRAAMLALARSGSTPARDRQFVSIEILNPIELAAARGRMLGFASSFAPGLTRRLVYDQTVKTLREQLVARGVVADVHVHEIRKVELATTQRPPAEARTLVIEPGAYVDEIDAPVDAPDDQRPV